MYRHTIFGKIMKCPNRNCRAVFYKDSHKGWLPKSELEVFTVMRCPACRDTFKIAQMINQVYDYKASLPTRELIDNKITIFCENDQEVFRKELFSDDNPLNSLYDGWYPGATDEPSDD